MGILVMEMGLIEEPASNFLVVDLFKIYSRYNKVDISSSDHIDNKKKKHISSWNRTNKRARTCKKLQKKCILSLHYNEANSYLFVNGTEIYKFKAKDSEIVVGPLFL